MIRSLFIGVSLLLIAGCNWSTTGEGRSLAQSPEAYFFTIDGKAISTDLQSQLVRWIRYSGGEYTTDATQAKISLEVISERVVDRTISVNALGQGLMCEKSATIVYRVSLLPDRTVSDVLTATTSTLYRRENKRETSLEYQNTRLQEKLAEDVSRYISLQLTAWNAQHAN